MVLFLVVGLIVSLTLGYFFLMFFFPEWVGISGEDTKKALESHRDENSKPHQDDNLNNTNEIKKRQKLE